MNFCVCHDYSVQFMTAMNIFALCVSSAHRIMFSFPVATPLSAYFKVPLAVTASPAASSLPVFVFPAVIAPVVAILVLAIAIAVVVVCIR